MIIYFTINTSYWYLENKVFCNVEKNIIKISLFQKNNNFLCKNYINTLDYFLKINYKNLININKILKYTDDTNYRENEKNKVLNKIITIQNIEQNIQKSISTFEKNIFEKIMNIIKKHINNYYNEIKNKINNSWNTWEIKNLITDKIIIEKIYNCKNLWQIFQNIHNFYYIKNKIWK